MTPFPEDGSQKKEYNARVNQKMKALLKETVNSAWTNQSLTKYVVYSKNSLVLRCSVSHSAL